MSLDLDERQRAMLAEMGVRVWLPAGDPVADTADEPVMGDAARARVDPARDDVAAPAATRAPTPSAPTPAPLSSPAPAMARAAPQALQRADWLIVGDPAESDDPEADPFGGPAGRLLDNMLRAMGLARDRDVVLTSAPRARAAEAGGAAGVAPFPAEQVAAVQPRVILAMGRLATQSLLQTQDPIGRLRGRVHDCHGVPVVVTYPPAYLLRNLPDKAKAWADLCLAMSLLTPAS